VVELPHSEAREKTFAEVPPRVDILKEDKLAYAVPEKLVLANGHEDERVRWCGGAWWCGGKGLL
jgi:hypothetical protein